MKSRFFWLVALLSVGVHAGAAERVYTPTIRPCENPAAVPAPKDDWYAQVQAKFDRYGNRPADVVFDGDSITNRWQGTGRDVWDRYFKDAADFGIEGDRVEQVMWRLTKGQLDGVNPKLVVLMIGTNNTGRDKPEQIADGIRRLIAMYLERCPRAELVLMGVFPRGVTPTDGGRIKVAAINTILSKLNVPRVHYVDIGPKLIEGDGTITPAMMPDGVHPNRPGYEIWADALKPFVEQYVTNRR